MHAAKLKVQPLEQQHHYYHPVDMQLNKMVNRTLTVPIVDMMIHPGLRFLAKIFLFFLKFVDW